MSKVDEGVNPKKGFETMVAAYLASNPLLKTNGKVSELEVRFGTNSRTARPISKIDYDNVVQQLFAAGFTTPNPQGLSILRIQNEYIDVRTGMTRVSNIRGEVVGLDLIQEYCRTNSLQKLIDMPSTTANKIKFTQKSPPLLGDEKPLKAVDFHDFNFRVSYQLEQDFNVHSNMARNILSKWMDSKKLFRYINRVRFAHPDLPVFADLSIVKGSKRTGKVPIPQYTVQEAGVFTNQESYEIELEVDNARIGAGTIFNTPIKIIDAIRKCIRVVLGGLQGTQYPIAYSERDEILHSYMKLLYGAEYQPRRVLPRDFVGPASYTLQLENIQPADSTVGRTVPNIRENYTVTDKEDGERKLLYVAENGRIYMIDTNMNVIFTGAVCENKTLHESLIDGEHIRFDKEHRPYNVFAAFDIYYIAKKSVRELGFIPLTEDEAKNKSRLPLLQEFIRLLNPKSVLNDSAKQTPSKTKSDATAAADAASHKQHSCDFRVRCKTFYMDPTAGIFAQCSTILSNINDGLFEYNTDGLIFTPTNTGVASDKVGVAGPLYKTTWAESFKWKPPQFNTIDFLVSVKKDKTGKDEVHYVFQEGRLLSGAQDLVQYKTLVLRCGFDERKHGYLNPMLDMINDNLPRAGDLDNEETYKPVVFQPTNPYDPEAATCNIMLVDGGNGERVMMTAEHEYFEEDMIVEFAYDAAAEAGFKWKPLRVRYDKTNELRSGMKNYGNAYHVANSNWHSIHNPVTEAMIRTGEGIPAVEVDEDVYYNRSGKNTTTRALRDFHNLYVKRKLILGVSSRKDTLIDYAVGKAGDLPKWVASHLGFVFGVDISKDNIENHLDGACARFLNFRKKYRDMPAALFVNGNSGVNIRSGKALLSDKDRQIANAVFGQGPKDRGVLGEGVYKHYGVGQEGFHVSSCQFALHYFFESATTFHGFLRNVAECTRIGGHFIGTCYDGKTVFQILRDKNRGEGMVIMRGSTKIYEIVKQYDHTGFPDDELSLGYSIDIYQESINKTFREYLVHFDYLVRVMGDYGFALVSKADAVGMGLPNSSGLFSELFGKMQDDVRQNRLKEADYGTAIQMSPEERQISFMNRYFVFRKMRNVNVEKVGRVLFQPSDPDDAPVAPTEHAKPVAARKLAAPKIMLDEYSPVLESPTQATPTLGKIVTIKRHRK